MINGLHQYSTEALIKELEKRGYSCIEAGVLDDAVSVVKMKDGEYFEMTLEDL